MHYDRYSIRHSRAEWLWVENLYVKMQMNWKLINKMCNNQKLYRWSHRQLLTYFLLVINQLLLLLLFKIYGDMSSLHNNLTQLGVCSSHFSIYYFCLFFSTLSCCIHMIPQLKKHECFIFIFILLFRYSRKTRK
jgi:hypothetical protein